MAVTGSPVVFLDKDGTVVADEPYNADPGRMQLAPRAGEGLRLLRDAGYRVAVVSNQSGVARGLFDEDALVAVRARLEELLAAEGLTLADFRYCPHHPNGVIERFSITCECRKPMPGMLLDSARSLGADPAACWMVGDILDDVEAGHRAGMRSVLIEPGGETEWRRGPGRTPDRIAVDLADAASQILARAERGADRARDEVRSR